MILPTSDSNLAFQSFRVPYIGKREQPVSLKTEGFFLPVDMKVLTFRAVIH